MWKPGVFPLGDKIGKPVGFAWQSLPKRVKVGGKEFTEKLPKVHSQQDAVVMAHTFIKDIVACRNAGRINIQRFSPEITKSIHAFS